MASTHVSAFIGPNSVVTQFDRPAPDRRWRIAGVEIDESLTIQVQGWDGDAAVVAACGLVIESFARIRDGAAARIRAAALAEVARERAGAASQPTAPQDAAEDAEVVEVPDDWHPAAVEAPAPVQRPARPATCGDVAGDGLMAGSVCTSADGHPGAHRCDAGSWPR